LVMDLIVFGIVAPLEVTLYVSRFTHYEEVKRNT